MASQGWNNSLDPRAVYNEILRIGYQYPDSDQIYIKSFDYFRSGLSGLANLDFQIFELGALWTGYNSESRNSRMNVLFKIRVKEVLQGFSALGGAFEKYSDYDHWGLTLNYYNNARFLGALNVDKFLQNFRYTFSSDNPFNNNTGY